MIIPFESSWYAMTSPVSLRKASLGDASAVTQVLEASYPELMAAAYGNGELAAALPMMTRAQPSLLESGTYYVAEAADGLMVGCGGWTRERPGSGEVQSGLGHLRHFGVRPEWTRRGIGSLIYRRCVADAKAAGVGRFECFSSLNGEAFYSALGFTSIEHIDLAMSEEVILRSVRMIADI
ncbi:MAG: GNAT family N-acetyltransferase [Gammaproteobacteria bacterium]